MWFSKSDDCVIPSQNIRDRLGRFFGVGNNCLERLPINVPKQTRLDCLNVFRPEYELSSL
jgi:hypothetical protein